MSQPLRAVLREAGAAIAVLSIYVLTLLIPLHQSAAAQRGFAELGYESFGVWSICTATSSSDGATDSANAATCPVMGIGKGELLAGGGSVSVPATFVTATVFPHLLTAPPKGRRHPGVHPRAPPLPV